MNEAKGKKKINGKFLAIDDKYFGIQELKPIDMIIIAKVEEFTRNKKECYMTNDQFVKITHESLSSVKRSIDKLTTNSYLKSEPIFVKGNGRANKVRRLSLMEGSKNDNVEFKSPLMESPNNNNGKSKNSECKEHNEPKTDREINKKKDSKQIGDDCKGRFIKELADLEVVWKNNSETAIESEIHQKINYQQVLDILTNNFEYIKDSSYDNKWIPLKEIIINNYIDNDKYIHIEHGSATDAINLLAKVGINGSGSDAARMFKEVCNEYFNSTAEYYGIDTNLVYTLLKNTDMTGYDSTNWFYAIKDKYVYFWYTMRGMEVPERHIGNGEDDNDW